MKIELAIHCYNYQHRLCWMLSSILQQKGNIPDIVTSISYLPNNGSPTTESVISFFKDKGLNIISLPVESGQESNRAIARNIRAGATDADWIIFVDGDMVYDPLFFEDLKVSLESDTYKDEKNVLGADRHSLDIPFCVKYFEEDKNIYPCVIEDVSATTEKWPIYYISGAKVAAGYFQLANVNVIKSKGGIYCKRNADHWRVCKSDKRFRALMGGVTPIKTKPQYHLNHSRGDQQIQN